MILRQQSSSWYARILRPRSPLSGINIPLYCDLLVTELV